MKCSLSFYWRINSLQESLSVPFGPSCFSDCIIIKFLPFSALQPNQQCLLNTQWALAPFWPSTIKRKQKRFEIIFSVILKRESGPQQPTQVLGLAKIKHIQFCSPSDLAPLCTWQMSVGSRALHIQLSIHNTVLQHLLLGVWIISLKLLRYMK